MFPLLLFLVAKHTQEIHDVISYVQPVCALVACLGPESQTPDPVTSHVNAPSSCSFNLGPDVMIRMGLPHTRAGSQHQRELAHFPAQSNWKKNEILVSRGDSSSGLWVLCRCSSFLPQTKNMHSFFILLLVLSKERLGCKTSFRRNSRSIKATLEFFVFFYLWFWTLSLLTPSPWLRNDMMTPLSFGFADAESRIHVQHLHKSHK